MSEACPPRVRDFSKKSVSVFMSAVSKSSMSVSTISRVSCPCPNLCRRCQTVLCPCLVFSNILFQQHVSREIPKSFEKVLFEIVSSCVRVRLHVTKIFGVRVCVHVLGYKNFDVRVRVHDLDFFDILVRVRVRGQGCPCPPISDYQDD